MSTPETPAWGVAALFAGFVAITSIWELLLEHLEKCLKSKSRFGLLAVVSALKDELLCYGMLSLLLKLLQPQLAKICIPAPPSYRVAQEDSCEAEYCASQGKVPLYSSQTSYNTHLLIFVVALSHIITTGATMVLCLFKVHRWQKWEDAPAHMVERMEDRVIKSLGSSWASHWGWCVLNQYTMGVTRGMYLGIRRLFLEELRGCGDRPRLPSFPFQSFLVSRSELQLAALARLEWTVWLLALLLVAVPAQHQLEAMYAMVAVAAAVLVGLGAKLQSDVVQLGARAHFLYGHEVLACHVEGIIQKNRHVANEAAGLIRAGSCSGLQDETYVKGSPLQDPFASAVLVDEQGGKKQHKPHEEQNSGRLESISISSFPSEGPNNAVITAGKVPASLGRLHDSAAAALAAGAAEGLSKGSSQEEGAAVPYLHHGNGGEDCTNEKNSTTSIRASPVLAEIALTDKGPSSEPVKPLAPAAAVPAQNNSSRKELRRSSNHIGQEHHKLRHRVSSLHGPVTGDTIAPTPALAVAASRNNCWLCAESRLLLWLYKVAYFQVAFALAYMLFEVVVKSRGDSSSSLVLGAVVEGGEGQTLTALLLVLLGVVVLMVTHSAWCVLPIFALVTTAGQAEAQAAAATYLKQMSDAAAAATPRLYLRQHLSGACSFKSTRTEMAFSWHNLKGGHDGLCSNGSSSNSRSSSIHGLRAQGADGELPSQAAESEAALEVGSAGCHITETRKVAEQVPVPQEVNEANTS